MGTTTTIGKPRRVARGGRTHKIGTDDNGRPVFVTVRIKRDDGHEVLSITGEHAGGSGQCVAALASVVDFAPGWSAERAARLAEIWNRWHLNDMKSGTPAQQEAIEAAKPEAVARALATEKPDRWFYDLARRELNPHVLGTLYGLPDGSYFTWACHVLKAAGLYEVDPAGVVALGGMPADVAEGRRGYRYGERWLYEPLPEDVREFVYPLLGSGDKRSPYDILADEFVKRFKITIQRDHLKAESNDWATEDQHWRVTLQAEGRRPLGFNFWNSRADTIEGKPLGLYSVLAALALDISFAGQSVDEVAADLGLKPSQARKAVRFAERLRAWFTDEEAEALREIR